MASNRKLGRKTVVVVALVALSAVVALTQVALEFTPGESGGNCYTEALKEAEHVGEAEGEFVVLGTGSPALESRVAPYDGLLDNGPARLTP
jgi:hypothetical protein